MDQYSTSAPAARLPPSSAISSGDGLGVSSTSNVARSMIWTVPSIMEVTCPDLLSIIGMSTRDSAGAT
jgi:hypothetical protein